MDKEINQIKKLETADYLATKDQDQIKKIVSLYLRKMRQKNNKQNKIEVHKKIFDKQRNQIK